MNPQIGGPPAPHPADEHQSDSAAGAAVPLGTLPRVVRNSTMNLAAVLAGNLATVVVLVKRLEPGPLGQYYVVFSVIWIVQLLMEAGISTILTHRLVQQVQGRKETLAEAAGLLFAVCAASLLVLAGLGAATAAFTRDGQWALVFVAAGGACAGMQVQNFVAAVFRADERFGQDSLSKLVQAFSFGALLFPLVRHTPHDLLGAVGAFALSNLLAGLYLCGSYWRNWGPPGWRLDRAMLRDWLADSIPVGLGDVFRRITLQVDTVLLGLFAPFAAAGIYNLAYRPLGFLRLVPRVILTVSFPSFSHLAAQSREALDRALARSVRLLWLGSLPLAMGIVVCADHLVLLIGSRSYAAAATPMRWLIWVVCLTYISTQFRFYLAALGRQTVFTRLSLLVLVVESALIAGLIPRWGYMGACYGVLWGEALFLSGGFAACHRLGLRGIEWGKLIAGGMLAASIGAVLWPLRTQPFWPLLGCCGVATVAYLAACAASGLLTRQELLRLAAAMKFTQKSNSAASASVTAPAAREPEASARA